MESFGIKAEFVDGIKQFGEETPPAEQQQQQQQQSNSEVETTEEGGGTPPAAETSIENQGGGEAPAAGSETAPGEKPNEEEQGNEDDDFDDSFEQKVLLYAKKKFGKETTAVEDLFKEKAPVQVEDKYENVSPEVKAFLEYNKETGRPYEDFIALKTDWSQKSTVELARYKAMAELDKMGEKYDAEFIDSYLEKKLKVDLDDPDELDKFDEITLKIYVQDFIEQKNKEKETYLKPLENLSQQNKSGEDPNMVTLENGTMIKKEVYDKMLDQRAAYLEKFGSTAQALDSLSYNVKVDENGQEKTLSLQYELSSEEKQAVLEMGSDIQSAILKTFGNEQGLDHRALAEGLFWANPKNRGKAIAAMFHKVYGQAKMETLKEVDNANFGERNDLPGDNNSKSRTVPLPGSTSGLNIKYDFSKV